jgi:hypothetical protein
MEESWEGLPRSICRRQLRLPLPDLPLLPATDQYGTEFLNFFLPPHLQHPIGDYFCMYVPGPANS